MKLLLIYPPFCAPTIRPYSISYIRNFVENNLKIEVKCLDLNAKFHKLRFPKYYPELKQQQDIISYGKVLAEFENEAREVYAQNHKAVIVGTEPELLAEMLQLITDEKAEYVAFSLVYNSQAFYGKALLEELTKRKVPCIIGGPAVPTILQSYLHLKNEVELINYLARQQPGLERFSGENYNGDTIPDF